MYVKGLFVEKPQTAEKAEGGLESLMCDTSSDANQTGVKHIKPETPHSGETVMGPKEGSAHGG